MKKKWSGVYSGVIKKIPNPILYAEPGKKFYVMIAVIYHDSQGKFIGSETLPKKIPLKEWVPKK